MIHMFLMAERIGFFYRHLRIQHLISCLIGDDASGFQDVEIGTLKHRVSIRAGKD